jgi:hypothetical protein
MVTVATFDFYGKRDAETEMPLQFTLGADAGNKYVFYAPKFQILKLDDEDGEGNKLIAVTGTFNGHDELANDEFAILQL